ncbi:uncharacterized protein LOC135224502 [Macrobrachium nipponense]|uniref:uncharacterized protein LOC135224502 n=1 Tax=Macrobrachium nipponense TaxID=159736 RepID=UPI0030C8256A
MAGNPMGPKQEQTISTIQKDQGDSEGYETVPQEQKDFSTYPREDPRFATVCVSDGHPIESQIEGYQLSLEEESQHQSQGQNLGNSTHFNKKAPSMDGMLRPGQVSTIAIPSAVSNYPHGCISERLGRLFTTQESPRNVVRYVPPVPHQCSRSDGRFPDPEMTDSGQEQSYKDSLRQFSSSPRHKQGRLQVKQTKSRHDCDIFVSNEKSLALVSNSPGRREKCYRRCTFQDNSAAVRVVPGQKVVPVDLQSSPGPSSRPIRHGIQSQTTMLHGTQPGPSSLHHRCNVHKLKHLAEDSPVSTSESSDEGPAQAKIFHGTGSIGGSQLAKEQLVSASSRTESPAQTDPPSRTDTGSTNSDCVSFLKNSECPNFMDFMKFAAQKDASIDPLNILFIESDKRESTLRQYDSAVKKLANFLKDSDGQNMTTNRAILFFRTLFEKGLAASTITTVKSALRKIFQLGFNINLLDSYFSSIPRACARLRPIDRPQTVSWFLNDVLKLASDTDNETCSYITLLRKTLFLMALASGARISELLALSRNPDHVEFLPSGEVLLSPDRKFLAKNEDPQNRWAPWKIIPLTQDASLCPIVTLKSYLARTSEKT